MINARCLCVSFFILCLVAVSILGQSVVQTPSDLLKKENEFAEIKCTNNVQNYDVIQLYKQSQSIMDLQFMGYLNIKQEIKETKYNDKIKLDGDGRNNVTLTINTLTLTDSAVYFCAAYRPNSGYPAYFGNGTKLTVLERDIRKPEVEILKPSGTETSCKQKVTLVCVATNFYPDHVSITWTIGNKEIKDDVATDPYATQDEKTKLFSITSRLKVSKNEFKPQNTFRCTVRFYNETDVYRDIDNAINGIAGGGYEPEDYVKSSQRMKLAYGVFIAKSVLYGLVILVYVWRQGSSGK